MADQVLFGPISFLAVGTADMNPETRLAVKKELKKLRDNGTIRVLDAVYATRDQFGSVRTKTASDMTQDDRIKLGAIICGLLGLGMNGAEGAVAGMELGAEAGAVAGDKQGVLGLGMLRDYVRDMVPEGTGVLVLLVEHTWAKDLKQALVNAGGVTLKNVWVTPEMFVEAGIELRAMQDMADMIEDSQMYEIAA